MARLQTVLDGIQTRITALYPNVTYRTGDKFLEEKIPNARVVWVPGKDLYEASRDGRHKMPRSVKTRRAEVIAYCFHNSFGNCEELVNWTVLAFHRECGVAGAVDEGTWSQPGWLEFGYLCELRFLVDIPITDVLPTTVVLTGSTFDTSTTVHADGLLDAGET